VANHSDIKSPLWPTGNSTVAQKWYNSVLKQEPRQLSQCSDQTECMTTKAAQKNDNSHTAQVDRLPALLHSILLHSILFNSDQAMGWTGYRKRSWDSSVSLMTIVKFLVGGRDFSCLLHAPTSSGAHPVF
jgi:hypothetical protein